MKSVKEPEGGSHSMPGQRKRKSSPGTVFMLTVTILVLAGTGIVLNRMSSGTPADVSRLQQKTPDLIVQDEAEAERQQNASLPTGTAAAAVQTAVPVPEKEIRTEEKTFSITVAGTVSLSGEVRQNSYISDVKQYDYYDTMMLLKKELQSDINLVFLENLLSENGSTSDVTASDAAAVMLRSAGFNTAACGFPKAFDKEDTGIRATRKLLQENGIEALGIYADEADDHFLMTELRHMQIAMLQYTDTIPAATRKSMTKKGINGLVPAADAEIIAADIAQAKKQGADAVLVFLNWGKTGKSPDKAMRALAQRVADAGADLIVGSGSRIVSGADLLTAAGTGRQVLCVWSLGTLLSGDRSSISRIAGMMLQLEFSVGEEQAEMRSVRYIPLYTWKYKQDGRYQYRCLAADEKFPDGMDSDQQKRMEKARETVRNAMKNSPAEAREIE